MAKRFQDKEHLQWIRQQPCLIQKAGLLSCEGNIEAHHLLQPSTGYRGGVKAGDDECIPLCRKHHALLHTKYGTDKLFLQNYGLPEDYARIQAKNLYQARQFYQEIDDDLPF